MANVDVNTKRWVMEYVIQQLEAEKAAGTGADHNMTADDWERFNE